MSIKTHCDICDKPVNDFDFVNVEYEFDSLFKFPKRVQVCKPCFERVEKYVTVLQKAYSMEDSNG